MENGGSSVLPKLNNRPKVEYAEQKEDEEKK